MGNPTPTVLLNDVQVISSSPLGKTGEHAKYVLEKDHTPWIWWRLGSKARICRDPNQKIDVSAVVELDEFRQVKRAKCLYKQHCVHFESPESLLCTMPCKWPTALPKSAPGLQAKFISYEAFVNAITRHPFGSFAACLTPNTAQKILTRLEKDSLLPLVDLALGQYTRRQTSAQFAVDRRYGLSGRCAGFG